MGFRSSRHTGNDLDLGNSVGITEDDTDLRRGSTLAGKLSDLLNDLLGSGLKPISTVSAPKFLESFDL